MELFCGSMIAIYGKTYIYATNLEYLWKDQTW